MNNCSGTWPTETTVPDIPSPHAGASPQLIDPSATLVSAGTVRMLVEYGKANSLDKARRSLTKVGTLSKKTRRSLSCAGNERDAVGTTETEFYALDGVEIGKHVVGENAHRWPCIHARSVESKVDNTLDIGYCNVGVVAASSRRRYLGTNATRIET
jgi:hypothetical protein